MATTLLAANYDQLGTRIQPLMRTAWNRSTVLGSLLKMTSESAQEKGIFWTVRMDGATASTFTDGADLSAGDFQVDEKVDAQLPFGNYHSAFSHSDLLINASAVSTASAKKMIKIWETDLEGSVTKLASKINQDLWLGDGSSNSIVGFLGGALAGAGSTYATISRDTYPLWAGNVDSTGGQDRPLTFDMFAAMESRIWAASNSRPDVIVCDGGTFEKYQGLFTSGIRVDGQGSPSGLGAGSTNLSFQGIPIVRDKDAPAGTVLFLNRSEVSLVYLPFSPDSTKDVSAQQLEGFGSGGMDRQGMGLPFQVKSLARTGHASKWVVNCHMQLQVGNPRALGYISDIDIS